jgi:glycerol dehydrogenase-like iron-containing ADH family enzyme
MDMDVICKEPPRYAASGIMDGMAKMIEIQNGRSEILLDDVSIGLFTAYTIAEMAYHVYEKEAHQACHDIAEGKLTVTVENLGDGYKIAGWTLNGAAYEQGLWPDRSGPRDLRAGAHPLHPGGKALPAR